MQRERYVSYREDVKIITDMDRLAESLGVDRSGLIRQTIRARLKAEADSATDELAAKYKKSK